jgi:uncharacterized protein
MRVGRFPKRAAVIASILALVATLTYVFGNHLTRLRIKALAQGVWIDHSIRVPTTGGQTLAASLYKPLLRTGPLPTILIRLPYDRLKYGEGMQNGVFFARHGYTVLVQDLRGTGGSSGLFAPWRNATADGAATLNWIGQQPWSTGQVGTIGCSALGETQLALARAKHPAHRAMIPVDAGGGVGALAGNNSHFGLFEGGVLQQASAFGWFLEHGFEDPKTVAPANVDIATAVAKLPTSALIQNLASADNAYRYLMEIPITGEKWRSFDFTTNADQPATPALMVNTWGDQSIDGAMTYMAYLSKQAQDKPLKHHMILAPGNHCQVWDTMQTGQFGALKVENTRQPYAQWYVRWFDYWLKGDQHALAALPPYLVYVLGEHRWIESTQWPPPQAQLQRWVLGSTAGANSAQGDGVLLQPGLSAAPTKAFDEWVADPADPVPSAGGPLCCTGRADEPMGPADQSRVEQRADVLVYTSAPLQTPLRIAGPLRANLTVSSTAKDTDLVARLVHVWPDGRATSIQEGALRLRYRDGYAQPTLLTPEQRVNVSVSMRHIAYYLPAGHRLRLHIASSSFPRLERNLQNGSANPHDEMQPVIARNRLYYSAPDLSALELYVLADEAAQTFRTAQQ